MVLINNRYRLEYELGKGSFGVTYKAYDIMYSNYVAIKMSDFDHRSDYQPDLKYHQMNISHPSLVEYYDVFVIADKTYVVMEYLAGLTLYEWFKDRMFLEMNKIISIIIMIGEGLKALHDAGLVHRDINPRNIFITRDFQVKILDFGLLCWNDQWSGRTVGTPAYISPEIWSRPTFSNYYSNDVWALSLIFYYLVHRQLPYRCMSLHQLKLEILTHRIISRCSVNITDQYDRTWINQLLQRMLMIEVESRWSLPELLQTLYQVPLHYIYRTHFNRNDWVEYFGYPSDEDMSLVELKIMIVKFYHTRLTPPPSAPHKPNILTRLIHHFK